MPSIVYFGETEWIGSHIVYALFYLLVEGYALCFEGSDYGLCRLEPAYYCVYLVADGEAALNEARKGSMCVSLSLKDSRKYVMFLL